jgi:hypothetical protein
MDIPSEVRAELKRLSPYLGESYIPELARENAKKVWDHRDPEEFATWQWDVDASGNWQWELELCDLDARTIDPAGYVAIRPLKQGKYLLVFVLVLQWPAGFDPKNFIFDSMQEAKAFLHNLLGADTPPIPL